MDVIIGSGSVYPFFPGRQMDKNEASFLIDGSYVHHRPIEAAWLRGATHVLLVDPNPNSERQDPKPSFYSSLGLAVEQLFHQAQSTDRAVLGKLTVIQFQPKAHKQGETGVSLLSFSNKPISEAIARGKKPDQIVLQMLNTGPPHFKDLEKFQEFNQLDTTKMAASGLYNKQAAAGTKPVVRGQSE